MRVVPWIVISAGAVLSLSHSAHAVFRQTPFLSLRDELVARRDGPLAGELDRDGKKQRKAVLTALRAVDRPAKDVRYDAKAAGRTAKKLAKAFADEFTASPAPDELGALCSGVIDGQAEFLAAAHALLVPLADDIPFGPDARFAALLDKLAAALAAEDAAPDDDLATRAFHLRRAAKAYVAAKKISAVETGIVHATIGGVPWKSTTMNVTYTAATRELDLSALRDTYAPPYKRDYLGFDLIGVLEPRVYDLPPTPDGHARYHQTYEGNNYFTFRDNGSGTITIEVMDPYAASTPVISGTFTLDLPAEPFGPPVIHIEGRFEARGSNVRTQ